MAGPMQLLIGLPQKTDNGLHDSVAIATQLACDVGSASKWGQPVHIPGTGDELLCRQSGISVVCVQIE